MRLFKRLIRKGQTGQSLVILAIGFLALLGFVGIVTDVSVLFIRYSTLSRAIDAAAIAAAGQMRRVPDTELGNTPAVADGQATSVANLNLAARQFIEVYGLDPKSVIVETCRAQQVARDAAGNPMDEYGVLLFNSDGTVNPAADQNVVKSYQQLCTPDELKLVRVTAQIDAPTIFLRLLGYPTVTLTDSAISQTAVLDVVMIFDVSESMLNETTYQSWDMLNPKEGVEYIPPYIDFNRYSESPSPWAEIANDTQAQLDSEIDPTLANVNSTLKYQTVAFEPIGADPTSGFRLYTPNPLDQNNDPNSPEGRIQPRQGCQVWGSPSTSQLRALIPAQLQSDYQTFLGASGNNYAATYAANHAADPNYMTRGGDESYAQMFGANYNYYSGFVPQYNSFACCNDPYATPDADGNYNFDNMICEPMRQARDAAHQFLARLDFLRGDRVSFVTFNREAYLVDPDGGTIYNPDGTVRANGGPQPAMMETQDVLYDGSGNVIRKGADQTLDDVVGVEAEPSIYVDQNNDGMWDALNDYGNPRTYTNMYNGVAIGDIIQAPVLNACPFDKASIDPPFLDSSAQTDKFGNPRTQALLTNIVTVPNWFMTNGYAPNGVPPGDNAVLRSYEYRASCSAENTGGALAAGSAELYSEGRREGAVWIMVMLSDGAAGASNPITRDGSGNPVEPANPYNVDPTTGKLDPQPGSGSAVTGAPTGYGFFGLCPYGTDPSLATSPTDPTEGPTETLTDLRGRFPYCSDLNPQYRHYCGTVALMPDAALQADTSCFNYYNVDDYARDWADWIGVADLPGAASGGTSGRVNDQLLPTIFTIGFGINYEQGQGLNNVSCDSYGIGSDAYNACRRGDAAYPAANDSTLYRRERATDYVGEETLRYIADVGDNNQIDDDYWQLQMSGPPGPYTCDPTAGTTHGIGNCIDLTSSSPDWGPRGPCEAAWTDSNPLDSNLRGNAYSPAPPEQSCGNYYVAATGQQLQDVFNQIASRMFTRLSQ